jgi:peroxiredoxin
MIPALCGNQSTLINVPYHRDIKYIKENKMSVSKLLFSAIILIFIISSMVSAGDTKVVEDFTLKNYDGKNYTLSDNKDAKAIVLMFIATRCPVSNAYNERMVSLYDDYTEKGVVFLGINSNKKENAEECEEHAEENDFEFPVLKDPENKIADKYDAQVTPEIFVVNSKLELLYHGRIDNSQKEDNVESQDLRNALDQILAGDEVKIADTKAFGCTIKRIN